MIPTKPTAIINVYWCSPLKRYIRTGDVSVEKVGKTQLCVRVQSVYNMVPVLMAILVHKYTPNISGFGKMLVRKQITS